MDFNENRSIYLQIADIICENILSGKWREDTRIPSVREIAVEMEVNPNTAVRAYTFLQDQNIIYNKRGIGYFVSPDGYNVTLEMKKKEFLKDDINLFFRKMELLKIPIEQIEELYRKKDNNLTE
jgi:GntR family transcriptional regulator